MTISEAAIEALKIIATIAIPYIGVLKARTELDRFAASQRAKQEGTNLEAQLRRRWYHPMFKQRKKKGKL